MTSLTAQNAQRHCCTCLANFDNPMETYKINNLPVHVKLADNPSILHLLEILVENDACEMKNYTQNICMVCFRVFEEIEEFRKNVIKCFVTLRSVLGIKELSDDRVKVSKHRIDEKEKLNEKLLESEMVSVINSSPTQDVEQSEATSDTMLNNDYDFNLEITQVFQSFSIPNEEQNQETTSQYQAIPKGSLNINHIDEQNDCSHIAIQNTKQNEFKTFKCNLCKLNFIQLPEYLKHIRHVHRKSKLYACEFCDKSYKSFDSLRKHLQMIHHRYGEPIKCSDCNKYYKTEANMRQHRRHAHFPKYEVNQSTDYACEQCHATFRKAISLAYHYLTKHSEDATNPALKFKCYVCDKMFKNIFNLDEHTLRFHVKERKSDDVINYEYKKKFKCDQCGRHYARKYDLVDHVRSVHCKIKAFKCEQCNQSFATANTLQHHMYRHTGQKPYVCDICDKAFRQPTPMKVHRRTHQQ